MQSPVVAVCAGCTRKAIASSAPCALTLISCVPDAWVQHDLLMEGQVDEEKLEAISEFCYICAGGGCELAAVICCKCAWG